MLRFTVFDEDLNQDERLGEALVDLGALNLTSQAELPLQVELDTQGSLSVVLTFESVAQSPSRPDIPQVSEGEITDDLSESSADSYSDAVASNDHLPSIPLESPVLAASAHEPLLEGSCHASQVESAPVHAPANLVSTATPEHTGQPVISSLPAPAPAPAPAPGQGPIADHPQLPVPHTHTDDAVPVAHPPPAVPSTLVPSASKHVTMHSFDSTSATIAQLQVQLQASRIDQDRYAQSCWSSVRNWAALLRVPVNKLSAQNVSSEVLAPTLSELSELILLLDPAMTQRLSLVEQLLTLNHRLVRLPVDAEG
jgi:hypothetical protein